MATTKPTAASLAEKARYRHLDAAKNSLREIAHQISIMDLDDSPHDWSHAGGAAALSERLISIVDALKSGEVV